MLLCSTKQKQHKNSCLFQRPVTHLQIPSALRVDFGSQPMAHTSGRKQGKGKQKEGVNNEPLMTSLPSGQWAQQEWGGKTGGPWHEAYAVATLSCATGASWSCSHTLVSESSPSISSVHSIKTTGPSFPLGKRLLPLGVSYGHLLVKVLLPLWWNSFRSIVRAKKK